MKKKHQLLKQITLICACFALVFGAGLCVKAAPAGNSGTQAATVYLNGQSGDDSRDGLSKDTAVKTFEQAKKLAAANSGIKTIDVTGTVALQGDVNLKGIQAIVKRDPAFNGNLFTVASNVTLSDITIDGGGNAAPSDAGALIRMDSGTLNIKDGTVLQNNHNGDTRSDTFAAGGAIFVKCGSNNQAVVNMTGGTITGNSAYNGGGVYVDSGTFNMSGGVIQNNTAKGDNAYGGGVCLNAQNRDAVMNFSGGTIKNNRADNAGGGISVGIIYATNHAMTLNMTDGIVEGNSAGKGGGGLLIQAGVIASKSWGVANVTGGRIQNNRMDAKEGTPHTAFGGGGIYVNGYAKQYKDIHNGVLNLENAVIQNNQAVYAGGGYAACPSSDTHIYVTDGAAFLGNQAKSAKAIYILASYKLIGEDENEKPHNGSPDYAISPSMLGGSPYNWQYDDGTEVPLNKLKGQLDGNKDETISLSTAKTSDAKAAKRAKVWITGNTSTTRGGGIGSNGTVNIGTEPKTEIAVKVDKKWSDAKKAHPDQVTVQLYRAVKGETPVYVGPETVSADQNWTMIFKNLPTEDPDGNAYTYTVKEKAVDGYTPTISGDQTKGFVITNTVTPKKPTTPPGDKTTPGNKTTTTPSKTQPTSGKSGVKTGDPTQTMAYLILMGAALAVLAGCGIYQARKRNA
ncbi:MAG: Cna B-type domain-containing protein [Pseudoramibacter sp.]